MDYSKSGAVFAELQARKEAAATLNLFPSSNQKTGKKNRMEYWCYDRKTVDTMAVHHETGERLPDELFEKILKARTYRAGSMVLRQVNFALTDLFLHAEYDPSEHAATGGVYGTSKPLKAIVEATTVMMPLEVSTPSWRAREKEEEKETAINLDTHKTHSFRTSINLFQNSPIVFWLASVTSSPAATPRGTSPTSGPRCSRLTASAASRRPASTTRPR